MSPCKTWLLFRNQAERGIDRIVFLPYSSASRPWCVRGCYYKRDACVAQGLRVYALTVEKHPA